MRRLILPLAIAAATLGGCALFSSGDRRPAPEPVMAPPLPPPAPMAPAPPEMETGMDPGAGPDDLDRGLPICPGDPRCKKSDPGE